MAVEFGNLESVDLRDAWRHEANDFTPWLAENLDRLSEAISIPLESVKTEAPVEQFSADILARNPLDDSVVLIENQLEWSDHTHLGQILTYLAGLEARTVIWVARDFLGAHLSAIRWLNENTVDSFNFFAVQVKVVRIGDSPVVPIFDVRESPSEWDRHVRAISQGANGSKSELTKFREEFWEYYAKCHPNDGIPQGRKSANVYHNFEDAGLHISQYLAHDSVGLWISKMNRTAVPGSSRELLQPYLPTLAEALEIDQEILRPSSAHRGLQINASDRENWPQMVAWLHNHLAKYRDVLSGTSATTP